MTGNGMEGLDCLVGGQGRLLHLKKSHNDIPADSD